MSCQACDTAQEIVYVNDEDVGLSQHTFVRVGRANVLISGCDEHLKDLIMQLRKGAENGNQESSR